jgi:hypothetical protein
MFKPTNNESEALYTPTCLSALLCQRAVSKGEAVASFDVEAALILAQEVDVALEEDFNEAMLAMLRDLPMQDIYQVCGTVGLTAGRCHSAGDQMGQLLATASCCAG